MKDYDLPDLTPPSPALSARSDSSRLGLGRLGNIASSLSRRSSRAALTDPVSSNRQAGRSTRGATPSSPLLQATVVEEQDNDDGNEDERSESESMPGSLPNASDFEKYRAAVARNNGGQADQEEEDVDLEHGEEGEEEDDDRGGEEEGDDFGEELDFTSVPVSFSLIRSIGVVNLR